MAKSVVVFDEVQTLPLKLVLPTLATLSHLSKRYQASVVFSTATQPAFRHLDERVREQCAGGWQPREIVPAALELFRRARRVSVSWPARDERRTWEEVADEIEAAPQALCIVNLKKHARELFLLVRERGGDGVFHLSTAMCPRHREVVLSEVRRRLAAGERCALIATQCVEAGVDLDFPLVLRAMGPLDAVAQAAGRCNRNGLTGGHVRVFLPADERYPGGVYERATDVAKLFLNRPGLSIDDPEMFESYYRELYSFANLVDPKLREAVSIKHFVDVARLYRLINEDTVNVLVRYRAESEALAREARNEGLSRDWVVRARPFTVNCRRAEANDLEPIRLRNGSNAIDWRLDMSYEHYDDITGYQSSRGQDLLEV